MRLRTIHWLSWCCILLLPLLAASPVVFAKRSYTINGVANVLVQSSRKNAAVSIKIGRQQDVVRIVSDGWQGGGTRLSLSSGAWPKTLIVRLTTSDKTAYAQMERFAIQTDTLRIHARYRSSRSRSRKFDLQKYTDYDNSWSTIGAATVKVQFRSDYIEFQVPAEILQSDPKFIKLSWVYMYSLQ